MRDVELPLKPHTVIIGENNAGKSSVLALLDVALNPTRRGPFFEDSDFTHGLDPETDRIEVVIEIRPWPGPVFGTVERAIFDPHIDILPEGYERILLKLEHFFDSEDGALRTRMWFMKSDGENDGPFLASVRRHIPFFMVPALRSAARDLIGRSGTWGRIVSGVKLDADKRAEIKKIASTAAQEIMELVLGNQAFSETKVRFSELLEAVLWLQEGTGELTFSALPADQRELLQAMQILIRNPGDLQGVGILDHGDGTQSIAVMALMLAYVGAMGYPNAALAIEEPESHLHPHATRSLVRYLWTRRQQVVITTHSTDVTDVVRLDELVVLKRRGTDTMVRSVPDKYFSEQELRELSRYVHTAGSEFFFAKFVLLTEGKTEIAALPIFAKALKIDLDRLGVSLVDVSGQNFGPFLKLFQPEAFDIRYLILCDNDNAAIVAANMLADLGLMPSKVKRDTIDSKRTELENAGLYFLPAGNFEQYIIDQGYMAAYEQSIAQVHGTGRLEGYMSRRVTSDPAYASTSRVQQILDFIGKEGRKPEIAFEVANIITNEGLDGTKIPPYLAHVLRASETLAKRESMVSDGDTSTGTQL